MSATIILFAIATVGVTRVVFTATEVAIIIVFGMFLIVTPAIFCGRALGVATVIFDMGVTKRHLTLGTAKRHLCVGVTTKILFLGVATIKVFGRAGATVVTVLGVAALMLRMVGGETLGGGGVAITMPT